MDEPALSSFQQILERLLSFPLRDQVRIQFDMKKKIFELSCTIFSSSQPISLAVKKYVEERKGRSFKPHKTSFLLKEDKKVVLCQEIPCEREGFIGSIREDVYAFCQMAKHLHRTLLEIAQEEVYSEISKSFET